MSVRFLPFDPQHLHGLGLQPAQGEFAQLIADGAYTAMLRDRGFALTAISADDANAVRVIGCAGILPQWQGRAVAWVLMGAAQPIEWTALVRRMRSAIDAAHRAGMRRIEATCDSGFGQGHRLLRVLGFVVEGQMRAYSPEARDHHLYAHIDLKGVRP